MQCCYRKGRTRIKWLQRHLSPSLRLGCAPSLLYVELLDPVGIYCQRFPAPLSPTPLPNNPDEKTQWTRFQSRVSFSYDVNKDESTLKILS